MSRSHSRSRPDVAALLAGAAADGTLSPSSLATLTVVDIGARIQAGLGVHVDDVAASEVVLVSMMPDDSGSIRFGSNAQAVREGHNGVLDALASSRQADSILVHNRYLNGHVLYPYTPLAGAERMTRHNYDPNQGTPLYDQAVVLLGTVLAKAQEFEENGVAVRTVTLLITDGADQHSTSHTAADVHTIVTDMLRAEHHTVAAMGVDDGDTDFAAVFREMGIPPEWILTPGNTDKEIRRAFQVFSRSAVGAAAGSIALTVPALAGFAVN